MIAVSRGKAVAIGTAHSVLRYHDEILRGVHREVGDTKVELVRRGPHNRRLEIWVLRRRQRNKPDRSGLHVSGVQRAKL